MGIVFLFIGIAAVAIGVRGQAAPAGKLLASEFTGPNSYIEWLAAIVILGVAGFWRPIRPGANAMLGLVILAMFIRKGQGFFDQINSALTSATAAPKPAAASSPSGAGAQAGAAAGNLFQPGAPDLGGLSLGGGAGPISVPSTPTLDFSGSSLGGGTAGGAFGTEFDLSTLPTLGGVQ